MNTNKKTTGLDMKAKLSTLWIFVLLNIIVRDIHEFFRSGLLEEIMTGTVNGTELTEELMLLGAIPMEILIFMVLLSRVLSYKVNRLLNISVGAIGIVFILGSGNSLNDLDDIFFATIEVAALSLIIWYAWKWSKQESESIPAMV